MARAADLMGVSLPPTLSSMLGNDDTTLVTTGTTQATAATIKSHNVTLTTAGSQTGAILPSGALIGTIYYVSNPAATTGIVYGPVGSTLNGAASTTGLNVAQNKTAIFWQASRGVWVSLLTA